MLAKNYRIGDAKRIEYILKKGRRLRGPLFLFCYTPSRFLRLRFACIASKKTSKTAVGRNRIRRRLYEAIRKHIPHLHSSRSAGYDVVVLGRGQLIDAPFAEIEKEIIFCLKKLSA